MRRFSAHIISALLVLSLLMLPGCTTAADRSAQVLEPLTNAPWAAAESPIPTQRTGLYRQGIYTLGKGFECSSSGVYFLCPADGYIIYCDHESNEFVPLCSRADCAHADYEGKFFWTCDAYWGHAYSICLYEGYLYVLTDDETDGFCIYRANPDGTERTVVWKASEDMSAYASYGAMLLWNGVLTYAVNSFDETGTVTSQTYCYRLDGSMEQSQPVKIGFPLGNHGDLFITYSGNERSLWDGTANSSRLLTESSASGYFGIEAAYVMDGGDLCRIDYESNETKVIFDTGLEENYSLHCFPDCFVLLETLPFEEMVAGNRLDSQQLHFYNWDYDYLGNAEIKTADSIWQSAVICGETANRLYLALETEGIPSHYIEKSDFGSGNIVLHEVILPTLPVLETGTSPPRNLS